MKKNIILLLLVLFMACSCQATKKWLGFEKSAPDESKIETRAPLVLPPDFDQLPE